MAGIFGETDFVNVTKQVQADMVHRFVNEESKVFGMIPKNPKWPGKPYHEVKWKVAAGGGGGASFHGAKNNTGYGSYKKPLVPQSTRYQFGRIDHKEAKATMSGEGSPLQLTKEAIADAWEGWGLHSSHLIWSDIGCSLAQIATGGVTGNVLTLVDRRQTVYFTLDMRLQGSATDGNTGAVYTGSAIVVGVDEIAGTITVDDATAINVGTGLAAADYLFAWDTFGQGLIGIPNWIPVSNPSAGEDFYNADRSIYPARMAGSRASANEGIRPATERFCGRIQQVGGRPKILVVNAERFSDLKIELDATSEIELKVGSTSNPRGPAWSFKAPVFQGPDGPMPIIADKYAPYRYMWFLDPSSWQMKSLGEWPHYSAENGGYLHSLEDDDASRFVLRGWGQLICKRPKDNGVLDLDPTS